MTYEKLSLSTALCALTLVAFTVHGASEPVLLVARPAINNTPIIEGHALPSLYRPRKGIRLTCCRGEYESASIVLTTDKLLQDVLVSVTLPGLVVDVKAVMPTLHVFYDHSQQIVREGRPYISWLLMHDPSLVERSDEGGTRWSGEPVDTATLQPQDVVDRAQFWVTVYVPDKVAPGRYRTVLRVTAAAKQIASLPFEVYVPSFELAADPFIRSVYYPTYLTYSFADEPNRQAHLNTVSDEIYLAECRDMARHGCLYPTFYTSPRLNADGSLDWDPVDHALALREQAGLPKGILFGMDTGVLVTDREFTNEEWTKNVAASRRLAEGAAARGYRWLVMGADEWRGERLAREHDSLASIREGGCPIWVATGLDFWKIIGNVIDYPVVGYPIFGGWPYAYGKVAVTLPEAAGHYRDTIHASGGTILTYPDPSGGHPRAEDHRRWRGLGLWKHGLDGTMTWAYIHYATPVDRAGQDINMNSLAFVVRGPAGPFGTLGWEAYREAADDSRYLATLQAAIAQGGSQAKQAQAWLDAVPEHIELDIWRRGMVRWIEKLDPA